MAEKRSLKVSLVRMLEGDETITSAGFPNDVLSGFDAEKLCTASAANQCPNRR